MKQPSLDLLHTPDSAPWRDDDAYSETVARALRAAYALIVTRHDRVSGFMRAANALTPLLHHPMSSQQRLHAYYILGLACLADDRLREGIAWLDQALDCALNLAEFGAMAELLYVRGTAHKALSDMNDAAQDFRDALAILRSLPETIRDPSLYDFECDTLLDLAASEFLLAHYSRATTLLDQARFLLPHAGADRLRAANLAWTQAIVHRWRGDAPLALSQALMAFEAHSALSSPSAQARIRLVVADIALDLAETGVNRDFYLALAQSHSTPALTLTRQVGDEPAEGLALLVDVRLSRQTQRNEARLHTIESVAYLARHLSDDALLGQVYTSLGQELVAAGEISSALNCYTHALSILDRGEVRALGVWAQRDLLYAQEALVF